MGNSEFLVNFLVNVLQNEKRKTINSHPTATHIEPGRLGDGNEHPNTLYTISVFLPLYPLQQSDSK